MKESEEKGIQDWTAARRPLEELKGEKIRTGCIPDAVSIKMRCSKGPRNAGGPWFG